MINNIIDNRARLLPTYRWDEWDPSKNRKVSSEEPALLSSTQELLLEYLHTLAEESNSDPRPPEDVVRPIIALNVAKRSLATRYAEQLIERGEVSAPPISLIPTFMASGHVILGVEDGYMHADHPSQEVFAYNRIGKKSWLNRRFGEHCLTAVSLAHPNGIVDRPTEPTRVKAHSSLNLPQRSKGDQSLKNWVIVSSKTPLATIHENGRKASLISRVTGAVDLASPELASSEARAIRDLSEHEVISEQITATALGQKALLLNALERLEGCQENAFYPVIQTVYLTQLSQK
ncbi:MAG: hypothetical protein WBK76_00180 [Candidatus Saccharimonadales bacterium]